MSKETNARIARHNRRQIAAIRKEMRMIRNEYRNNPILIALTIVIIGMCLVAGAVSAAEAGAATRPDAAGTACFSTTSWSADQADRPCVTLVPVADGFRVIQGTASVEQAECFISTANINDARCHRVAGNRAMSGPAQTTPQTGRSVLVYTKGLRTTAFAMRPQEDGSVGVTVQIERYGRLTYVLGNPTEERGRYGAGYQVDGCDHISAVCKAGE